MSDKDRRKKEGHDTNKDRQAMRESVKERHAQASRETPGTDDERSDGARLQNFKPGAASDRNTQGRAT
jgi:hypothetical protein